MKTDKTAFKKRLLCFCVALVCLITAVVPCVSAEESLDEMQNRYEELEKDIEKNEQALAQVQQDIKTNEKKAENISNQIEKIEEQIDLLDESIDILNGDISDLQSSIDVTTNDIESINSQISEIELQIEQTDALMAETREMLLARIRENYMAGGTGSTLELLLSSGDISSFFARKELVTSVSENDAQLVNDLADKINELNDLQKELEEKKTTLEEKKTELDSQMDSLNEREDELESSKAAQESKKSDATEKYDELKYIINELDKDSDVYKKTIKRQQAEREALEAEIDEYIRQHGSSQGDVPDEEYENDGDMMWPVKGDTRITAGYPAYSDGSPHWGIDIVKSDGNTRGEPFYAAQGGEVIIAKNDGNWNSGFGNYCVIDHGDGTQTLYAHSDNILVSVGQVVKKGEKIGIIGATGNVTGPHLHFEVRVKKADGSVSRVNPLDYVSKP
ncbi:MAG: murein hydrolase activator EnvC family protein [Acutalibacteraceae bacterium]